MTNISGGGSWSSRDTEAKKEARKRDGNTEITLRRKRSGQAEKREEHRGQRERRGKDNAEAQRAQREEEPQDPGAKPAPGAPTILDKIAQDPGTHAVAGAPGTLKFPGVVAQREIILQDGEIFGDFMLTRRGVGFITGFGVNSLQ